jgi:hypothetical protein
LKDQNCSWYEVKKRNFNTSYQKNVIPNYSALWLS